MRDEETKEARKEYMSIVNGAKPLNDVRYRQRKEGLYFEHHHVLPKAKDLFPLWAKRKSNVVLLTAREHYRCHELAVKIWPKSSMRYAIWQIAYNRSGFDFVTAEQYEEAARLRSEFMRDQMTAFWKDKEFREGRITAFRDGWDEEARRLRGKLNAERPNGAYCTARKIECVETGRVFGSIKEATEWAGSHHVADVAEGKRMRAGGYDWRFVDETKDQSKRRAFLRTKTEGKFCPIVCIETGDVYASQKEASKALGIATSTICKYISLNKTWRGLTFKKISKERYYDSKVSR